MNIEAVNLAGITQQSLQKPSDDVAESRKAKESGDQIEQVATEKSSVQPEELLQQIKGLTEDGAYSVRFENDDDAQQLVVKIVDTESDEVIRQVPAEEILELSSRLEELRGNIVNTQG